MKRRTAILISGRGSNMAALIEAARHPAFPARIDLVLSNNPDALGLTIARDAGIIARSIDHRAFGQDRAAHERAMNTLLRTADIEIICLAGYLRILSATFVQTWQDRILNIHPSLLPAFPGLHTHARALAAKVAWHGCTVHTVSPELDCGTILAQARVAVSLDESEEQLAHRVLQQEHRIYPLALAAFATKIITPQ